MYWPIGKIIIQAVNINTVMTCKQILKSVRSNDCQLSVCAKQRRMERLQIFQKEVLCYTMVSPQLCLTVCLFHLDLGDVAVVIKQLAEKEN